MAAGEYVSVSSQSDTERADLARERKELEEDDDGDCFGRWGFVGVGAEVAGDGALEDKKDGGGDEEPGNGGGEDAFGEAGDEEGADEAADEAGREEADEMGAAKGEFFAVAQAGGEGAGEEGEGAGGVGGNGAQDGE